MSLGDIWTLNGNAAKVEASTACPPLYHLKLLRNDTTTSGSIYFGLNAPYASGSYVTLAPGETLQNFDFENLTRLYYSTNIESASPAFRMIATTKRVE